MADNQSSIIEEWRPAFKYEDTYSVSNLGRVRCDTARNNTPARTIRKLSLTLNGYPKITLPDKGRTWTITVHRLMMLTFIGPCPAGYVVNHKDGVKTNNTLSNLEYVLEIENHRHAQRLGLYPTGERHMSRTHPERLRRGEHHKCAKLTTEQVKEIRRLYAEGGCTFKALASTYKVSQGTINAIVHRVIWKHLD